MKRSRVRFPLWARCDHVFPAIGTTAGACMTSAPASVDEIRFRGEPAVRVASGDLSATFLPDVGLNGLALGTDTNGLPIHGFLVGRPGWRLGRCWTRGSDAKFRADIDVDE